jgi:hypothetical protein
MKYQCVVAALLFANIVHAQEDIQTYNANACDLAGGSACTGSVET